MITLILSKCVWVIHSHLCPSNWRNCDLSLLSLGRNWIMMIVEFVNYYHCGGWRFTGNKCWMFRGESRSCRDNRPTCLPYCACNLNLFSQKCKSNSDVFNRFFLDCTYGIANISVHGDQDRVGNEKEGPGGKFWIAFSMEKCSLTMPYSGAWRPNCQWPPCLQSTCPICPFQSFSRSHTFLTNSESGYIRDFFLLENSNI